jgi:acetyl-CoA carboxylase carboxyl transferase subunit beta
MQSFPRSPMAWFRKDKKPLKAEDRRDVPTDVFDKCEACSEILYSERLAQNLNVCPNCGHHLRISAQEYVGVLIDEGTFKEMDEGLRAADPLGFTDLKPYSQRRLARLRRHLELGSRVRSSRGGTSRTRWISC